MKKTVITILLLLALIASFLLGANITKNQIAKSADKMQSELSFLHLGTYQDLQSDIFSGCMARAKSRLEFVIDEQKMLMAEYVQSVRNEEFEHYINMEIIGTREQLFLILALIALWPQCSPYR